MPVLRKIFLDDNEIKVLNGLQECERLEELRIARQRLPSFVSLHFDLGSLQGIARSLETIDISGNFISDLSPFSMLYNLRKFICKDNNVNDLIEVEKVVVLPYIAEVDLTGNPCATFFKYRDIVIAAASDSLRILDEIPIQDHQQVAIKGLMEHRKAIGAMARFNGSYNSSQEHEFDFGEN